MIAKMLREDSRIFRLKRYPKLWWRSLTRPERITYHGVKLELGDHVTPEIRRDIYAERYERGEARWLVWELEPDDIVMEIGAGMGFISTLCALRLGSDRVFTYEANPALIPVVEAAYELNDVRPTLVNAVLAAGEGSVEFFVEEDFVASSVHRRSDHATPVSVPKIDINREIERIQPTFMVVDIEGAEEELVPLVDWAPIHKVIIDLHPHVIGDEKTANVLAVLTDSGLEVDTRISTTTKRLLRRG
jgi:FkbM family methyltransferase